MSEHTKVELINGTQSAHVTKRKEFEDPEDDSKAQRSYMSSQQDLVSDREAFLKNQNPQNSNNQYFGAQLHPKTDSKKSSQKSINKDLPYRKSSSFVDKNGPVN